MLLGEKGTGTICRNGPKGAAHKLYLSPFLLIRYATMEKPSTLFGNMGIFRNLRRCEKKTGPHNRYGRCHRPLSRRERFTTIVPSPAGRGLG